MEGAAILLVTDTCVQRGCSQSSSTPWEQLLLWLQSCLCPLPSLLRENVMCSITQITDGAIPSLVFIWAIIVCIKISTIRVSGQSFTTGRINIVQVLSLLLSLQPADRIARDKRINAQKHGGGKPSNNTQLEPAEGIRFFLLSSEGFSQVSGQDKIKILTAEQGLKPSPCPDQCTHPHPSKAPIWAPWRHQIFSSWTPELSPKYVEKVKITH